MVSSASRKRSDHSFTVRVQSRRTFVAEYRTLKGKVKSVNKQNSGFTLEDDPQTWLNYSKQGDGAKVARDAQRGDVVEVSVNDNNWVQSLKIVDSAGRQSSNGSGARPGGVPGTWSPAPRDPRDSLHIGRQSALKAAVEFCGFMPAIEPTLDAARERAEIVIAVATEFSKFVNVPLAYVVDEQGNVRAPGTAAAAPAPQQSTSAPQAVSAAAQSGNGASGQAPSNVSHITYCQRDGQPIKGVRFRDDTTWTAEMLVQAGKDLCGEALCSRHFFEERDDPAKIEARKQAAIAKVGEIVQTGVTGAGLGEAPAPMAAEA
jgi:hypothetical protein